MLDRINRSLSFLGQLFETHHYHNGAANVISDNPGLAALTSFQSSNLLGITVKLLNLPTQTIHILYGLNIVLSLVVRYDIVSEPPRTRTAPPGTVSLYGLWETLDLHDFAMLLFWFGLFQHIHSTVSLSAARIVPLAIIIERAVIHFLQLK